MGIGTRIGRKVVTLALKQALPRELWITHDNEVAAAAARAACGTHSQWPNCINSETYELSERLRSEALTTFCGKHKSAPPIKALIHVPPLQASPGGFFLFNNWIDGLRHLGVEAHALPVGEPISPWLSRIKPHFLFTSDHDYYLSWIEKDDIGKIRDTQPFVLAMTATAGTSEADFQIHKIERARRLGVDFVVSFRGEAYNQQYLGDWREAGYRIITIPFGTNPLRHYCAPSFGESLDFAFLGSLTPDKVCRYWTHLRPIARTYRGVVSGPGWGHKVLIPAEVQPYLYSGCKIALNLHIANQLTSDSEINERAFLLAGMGAFQLSDNPLALRRFFSPSAVPSASNAKEYSNMFDHYIANESARSAARLAALAEVYSAHTIFHRMDELIGIVRTALTWKMHGNR